jgi:hypothetical protein
MHKKSYKMKCDSKKCDSGKYDLEKCVFGEILFRGTGNKSRGNQNERVLSSISLQENESVGKYVIRRNVLNPKIYTYLNVDMN